MDQRKMTRKGERLPSVDEALDSSSTSTLASTKVIPEDTQEEGSLAHERLSRWESFREARKTK